MKLGVISDTHGLLRPEALHELRGSDHIIHAGDIGAQGILDSLLRIAPVTAVRGNNDTGAWASVLPNISTIELDGVRVHVLHDLAQLRCNFGQGAIGVVIAGHSHQPKSEHREGVLYLNPGSAGPRRFRLPVTLARLYLDGGNLRVEFVDLA